MNGRPSAGGIARRDDPAEIARIEAARHGRLGADAVDDTRATLIMFGFIIQVSEPMKSCSVAIAMLPAGEKFEPPSGLTLSVCPNIVAAEHRCAVAFSGSRRGCRTAARLSSTFGDRVERLSVVLGSGM